MVWISVLTGEHVHVLHDLQAFDGALRGLGIGESIELQASDITQPVVKIMSLATKKFATSTSSQVKHHGLAVGNAWKPVGCMSGVLWLHG